jgi:FlaA1/EpsC-like NDP-sugar epimerase
MLQAAKMMAGGEVFVLKMPVVRIADLADVLIQDLAPLHGYDPHAIPIVEIGPHRGEKLFEEMLTDAELVGSYENDELIAYLGVSPGSEDRSRRPYLQAMRRPHEVYSSDRIAPMTPDQIEAFLQENQLLPSPTLVGQLL